MNNQIKKLAKTICATSNCHHKCQDTDSCIVEDEAVQLSHSMTDKEKITQVLLDCSKKRHIAYNIVTLEILAEDLIEHGLVFIPTRCQSCTYRTDEGFCYVDIGGVGYKKTHDNGYCDKGEEGSEWN